MVFPAVNDPLTYDPVALRHLTDHPEVAPREWRCGATASTGNVLGPRQVTCVRRTSHDGLHASIPQRAFPQLRRWWVYSWH